MSQIILSPEPLVEDDVVLQSTVLGAYTHVQAHSVLNEVSLGDYSYCAGYNQIDYAAIGRFCSIASFARINPGNHPTHTRVAQHHFTYRSSQYGLGGDDGEFFDWRRSRPVTLGNDVWVGHNVSILPGVTVGNGAVIGAGAVVTKDVEPYSIAAGVPARKIGMRFPDALIERIEKSRWWNWDHETLRERLPDFRNFAAFAEKYL